METFVVVCEPRPPRPTPPTGGGGLTTRRPLWHGPHQRALNPLNPQPPPSWGPKCSVVYIALKMPWYDGYCTERTMRYGTVLYVAVVFLCAIPLRWGIAGIFLLLDCKDNRQSTHIVCPLGLGIRTRCVTPWVGGMDSKSTNLDKTATVSVQYMPFELLEAAQVLH